MALLKYHFKGSSLPEVLVASVILLLSFMFTLDLLVRIGHNKEAASDLVAAEIALRNDLPSIGACVSLPFLSTQEYPWGEIRTEYKTYNGWLYELVRTATFHKSKREISYRRLISSPSQYK